ncbi:MAG: efflux RND transporter periplasmic adaptor subunit [Pelagibacteraceae bacterium]|jgi:membrane fusion protein (multidrug efflux system)
MTSSKKLKIILIIILIAIVAVIAGRYFVGQHFKKKFSVRPAPGVIVEAVTKKNFYDSIETFGTAIALNSKTYRVKKEEIEGSFESEGKIVKKNDLIIKLKSGEIINADFDGKLGKREIAQGVLGTDSFIITLDDSSKIVIDIKVPENFVGILKNGLDAEIKSDAFDKIFYGSVESVSSRVDPSTRSILARVVVNNKDYELIPGQLLTVKVIYNKKETLGISERAITIQGDSSFVYVVQEGDTVAKRDIKIGQRNFGLVSVIEGLNENEKIVSEGISKVRDKAKVKIINKTN